MKFHTHFYRGCQKVAYFFGFDLFIKRSSSGDYESIFPRALYAPWLKDYRFNETYEIIKNYSMVDKYRCYELWQLVKESTKLTGALIEIGSWRGGSGALIAKISSQSLISDTVYICDTFTGVVKAGKKDSSYKNGEHSNTSKEIAEELIDKLKLDNVKILPGIFPEETASLITDETFRFCHIDVDVYESAKDIMEWLWPKLVSGGMVVFDDYGFKGTDGITNFVNEERNKKDRLVIHNLNGHAILIKLR